MLGEKVARCFRASFPANIEYNTDIANMGKMVAEELQGRSPGQVWNRFYFSKTTRWLEALCNRN